MAAALVFAAGLLYSAFSPGVSPTLPRTRLAPAVVQEPGGVPPAVPPEAAPGVPIEAPLRRAPAGSPEAPAGAPGPDLAFAVVLPAGGSPFPTMTVRGSAPYPEGTVLLLTGFRTREELAGGRLVPVQERLSSALSGVKDRKFESPLGWGGPGRYRVTAALAENQPPGVMDWQRRSSPRPGAFEFEGWGDELVGRLGPRLAELDRFQKESLEAVEKIEVLASKESTWIKERRNVDARGADLVLTKEADQALQEAGKLMVRLESSEVRSFYPAAWNELVSTLRSLRGCAQHLQYEAGRFARARSYHSATESILTHRGEPFGFGALRSYVGEASSIAGRELALWIVKELRRTQVRRTPDLGRLLQSFGPHAGVSAVAGRLEQAGVQDLEALEKELRAAP